LYPVFLYKPIFGTELGKSSSAAFNSQITLEKLVFTDCWDLASPQTPLKTSVPQSRNLQQQAEKITGWGEVGAERFTLCFHCLGNDNAVCIHGGARLR
jgi:hypothetical protein